MFSDNLLCAQMKHGNIIAGAAVCEGKYISVLYIFLMIYLLAAK